MIIIYNNKDNIYIKQNGLLLMRMLLLQCITNNNDKNIIIFNNEI